MPSKMIDTTLEHISDFSEREPTLWDLYTAQNLWEKVQRYWETLGKEVSKRLDDKIIIRVLDFDIIYPAFWPAEMQRPAHFEERLGFPMTTEFIFRNTKTAFTLPPGTLFELARYILRLEEDFDITSNKLRGMVHEVERFVSDTQRRATGGLTAVRRSPEHNQTAIEVDILRKIAPKCEEEVERLIVTGIKLNSLSFILNHSLHQPWGEVSGGAKGRVNYEELTQYRDWFSRRRPDFPLNNYLDALNVASYSTLLKTQTADGGGASYFPMLASSTQMILELRMRTGGSIPLPSASDETIQPVTAQYLSFATAVEKFANFNLNRLHTFAQTGLELVQSLNLLLNDFWFDWKTRFYPRTAPGTPNKPWDTKYLKQTPLSEVASMSTFRDFCNAYIRWRSHFSDVVGNTFLDVARADKQLRESYLSTKRRLLNRVASGGDLDLEEENNDSSSFNWTRRATAVESTLMLQRKELNYESRNLKALRQAKIIKEEHIPFLNPSPVLRTVVSLPDIGEILFRWERAVGSHVQLCCWDHGLSIEKLLQYVREFFLGVLEVSGSSSVRLHIYSEDDYVATRVPTSAGSEEWIGNMLAATTSAEYVRADGPFCSVFVDLMPMAPATNLEMAVLYSKPQYHTIVSNLHHVTSNITMTPAVVEDLLREYDSTFLKKEQWVSQLAAEQDG